MKSKTQAAVHVPIGGQHSESITLIPLRSIFESEANPRKAFRAIEELAASIHVKGVLDPILVRPMPMSQKLAKHMSPAAVAYELVDGARRFRASRLAGLAEIPARVREMTDAEAADARLISFDQKEDIGPTERAAAYQERVDAVAIGGKTVASAIEELAATVGKSPSTIRSFLLLSRMPAKLAAAVEAGEVPRTTAEVVCRVPSEFHRERLAECVIHGRGFELVDDEEFNDPKHDLTPKQEWEKRELNPPLSYRGTKELVQHFCQLELKGATFSRKALDLVPEAGSCDACPKRAGNDPDLVADGVRADICTDPGCFRRKTEAHAERLKAEAEKSGRKVLDVKEAEQVFDPRQPDQLRYGAPYIDLAGSNYSPTAKKNLPYSKMLKLVADQAVVAIDSTGKAHSLVPMQVAAAVLKKDHGIQVNSELSRNGSRGSGPKSEQQKADEARRRWENKVKRATEREVLRRAAQAGEMTFLGSLPSGEKSNPCANQILRVMAAERLSKIWGDRMEDLAVLADIDDEVQGKDYQKSALEGRLATLDGPQIMGFVVQLLASEMLLSYRANDKEGKKLSTALGIDLKAIEKSVTDQLKAEERDKTTKAKAKTQATAARTTKSIAEQAAELDAEIDAEIEAETWRKTPVADLELSAATTRRLADQHQITTIGELADALDEGRDIGLGAQQEKVRGLVEDVRGEFDEVPAAKATTPVTATAKRACRVCGCTDDDCRQCIKKTGGTCTWVEQDLCSACVPKPYAWDINIEGSDGTQRTICVVAPTQNQARTKAATKIKANERIDEDLPFKPITKEAYVRAYGDRKIAGH